MQAEDYQANYLNQIINRKMSINKRGSPPPGWTGLLRWERRRPRTRPLLLLPTTPTRKENMWIKFICLAAQLISIYDRSSLFRFLRFNQLGIYVTALHDITSNILQMFFGTVDVRGSSWVRTGRSDEQLAAVVWWRPNTTTEHRGSDRNLFLWYEDSIFEDYLSTAAVFLGFPMICSRTVRLTACLVWYFTQQPLIFHPALAKALSNPFKCFPDSVLFFPKFSVFQFNPF